MKIFHINIKDKGNSRAAKLLVFLVGLSIFSGCEQVIKLDLDDSDPWVVFQGAVTTDPGPYRISIKKTLPYYSEDTEPAVTDAFVTISDDLGNLDILTEVEPGIYETDSMQGVIGVTYTLRAAFDGITYTATHRLNRINPIDTLVATWLDQPPLDEGYYIVFVAQEAAGRGDFYRFKFYKNDTLYNDAGDLYVTDDQFSDGNLAIFPFPYKVEPGDSIQIEALSIDAVGYDYYSQMRSLIQSAGSPFGAPPDNLPSNFDNGALGYFGAWGITRKSTVVPL